MLAKAPGHLSQYNTRPAAVARVKLAVAAMQLSLFSAPPCNIAAPTRLQLERLLNLPASLSGFVAPVNRVATSLYDVDDAFYGVIPL